MSDFILETKGLTKHYGGVHALEGADFQLEHGEHVAIMGDNGAGKSTFVRQITGVEQRTRGEVIFDGQPVNFAGPLDAREAGIETVFQTLALADHLDAPANLFLGRELKTRFGNLDDARMLEESRKVLARLNPNFKNLTDPVSSLSGGQRQVIAIARAIYFDTKVLIMDEPTAALGPSETAMVADLIRQLQAEGIGILLVSHDMHDVFDLCNRVVVMNKGRLVGAHGIDEVSKDDVLSLIVKGELPADWSARNLEAVQ